MAEEKKYGSDVYDDDVHDDDVHDDDIYDDIGTKGHDEYEDKGWRETGQAFTQGASSDGIKLVSAYHFLWSLLLLLGMCGVSIPTLITGIVGVSEDPEALIATAILGFVVFVLLLLSALWGAVGYGLWTRRQWARTAAIALGVLSLLAVPIGTLGGGVTIWYLLKDEVSQQFR